MSGNLYKRGAVWWGRIQVAVREHRRSLRTGDRTEAKRRFKAWREELIGAAHFGIERRTWQEAVAEYVKSGMGGIKRATAKRYLCSFRMVDALLGGLYLDQVDRRAIARVAGRQGPTNATRRRDLTAVSSALRYAVSQGWIDANPARDFDRDVIAERRDPIRLPTDDEINQLIGACPPMLAALCQTLLWTGMRLEEAGSLERRQVDYQRGVITLDRTKTDSPRAVRMSAQVVGTLKGLPVKLGCPFIFWHEPGRRYANLSSRLAAIGRRAKVRFRRHDLRHRYAVDYLKAGGSIYDLQKILGHSSIKTTEMYLAYLTPEEQLVAMRLGA